MGVRCVCVVWDGGEVCVKTRKGESMCAYSSLSIYNQACTVVSLSVEYLYIFKTRYTCTVGIITTCSLEAPPPPTHLKDLVVTY